MARFLLAIQTNPFRTADPTATSGLGLRFDFHHVCLARVAAALSQRASIAVGLPRDGAVAQGCLVRLECLDRVRHAEAMKVEGFWVFLLFTVINIGLIAWCFWLVKTSFHSAGRPKTTSNGAETVSDNSTAS